MPAETSSSSVSHATGNDRTVRRLVWVMVIGMLLSFTFGVAMFLPEEHRAQKLEETMAKYQARKRTL